MDRESAEALVATTQRRISRAWLQMRAHLRETNSIASIVQRIQTGEPVGGIQRGAASFAAGELAAYVHGGQVTARWLADARVRKKLVVFDAAEPGAVGWAQRNRLDKIREISGDQRDMIHGILVRGARAGTNPKVMAVEIRESIGLTAYQEQIVANYRLQLERGGAYLQAALDRELVDGNAERTIRAAIRDNKAIPRERIDAMVEAYRKGWVAYRAENIARTEGLRVAHQASDELYRQAVERGDVQDQQLERTWVHSRRGPHGRSFHAVMRVGVVRGVDAVFVSGLGNQLRYPGDPQAPIRETAHCGCVVTTRLRPV